ncbi:ShlB/FhaC/HecB family hemolysin secretion/activation protein, partial [Planctomycetota bacterium]
PWIAYFQMLNTGTEQTRRWRERFGFIHNQLTHNDDILSVDYITAGFNEAHAIIASYEAPLLNWDRIRWRISGLSSEFDASETFHGEEWNAGGEIIANVYQNKELFVDVVAGLYRRNIMVENTALAVRGKDDFLLPRVGIDLEQREETFSIFGSVDMEWNCAGAANTDDDEVNKLGRLNSENDWTVFHWRLLNTFYLDPWLMGDKWDSPSEEDHPNLTHELVLNFSGQYSPDRLIPQAMFPVGGMYTVRGYPETVATGDSVMVGNIEYGYHLPRAFPVKSEPGEIFGKTFRWAPQRLYDQPDWDLVLRAFFDVAQFRNTGKLFTEQNKTLMGCGLGVELQMFKNVSIRCDWGFALEPFEAGRDDIKSGDNRFHLVGTFSF